MLVKLRKVAFADTSLIHEFQLAYDKTITSNDKRVKTNHRKNENEE